MPLSLGEAPADDDAQCSRGSDGIADEVNELAAVERLFKKGQRTSRHDAFARCRSMPLIPGIRRSQTTRDEALSSGELRNSSADPYVCATKPSELTRSSIAERIESSSSTRLSAIYLNAEPADHSPHGPF